VACRWYACGGFWGCIALIFSKSLQSIWLWKKGNRVAEKDALTISSRIFYLLKELAVALNTLHYCPFFVALSTSHSDSASPPTSPSLFPCDETNQAALFHIQPLWLIPCHRIQKNTCHFFFIRLSISGPSVSLKLNTGNKKKSLPRFDSITSSPK
jgi:hypothetical protein